MPQGSEWIFIIIAVVVLFGGSQIPKLARSLGEAKKEFKQGLDEGASEESDDKADRASS
ncbi:MAG TPA: twin-arginine translocase TatA/TatE family subunit [Microthrixaceae bacterium]|nr:twin-arginine translocase TatA/TatE family subunit [Microthrixaceae bacterium]